MNVKITLSSEDGHVNYPMAHLRPGSNGDSSTWRIEPFSYPELLATIEREREQADRPRWPIFFQILTEVVAFIRERLGGYGEVTFWVVFGDKRHDYVDLTLSIQPRAEFPRLVAGEVARLRQKYQGTHEETTYIKQRGKLKEIKFLLRLPISEHE